MQQAILQKILLLLFMIVPMSAYCEDNTIEATIGNYKYSLNQETKEATVLYSPELYNSYSINIPSTVTYDNQDFQVTTIGKSAFKYFKNLKWINIPSIKNIEEYAFCNCTSLAQIDFPKSIEEIGEHAFEECTNLITLEFHGPVIFHSKSFSSHIKTIRIDNIADWCNSEFRYEKTEGYYYGRWNEANPLSNTWSNGCSLEVLSSYENHGGDIIPIYKTVTELILPKTVTKINKGAFCYYRKLKKLVVPNSTTYIGDGAFFGCDSLTVAIIPTSVSNIGISAFKGCN